MIMSRSAAETASETPRNQMRAGAAESSDLLQSLAVLFSWKLCTHTHAESQEVCGGGGVVVGGGVGGVGVSKQADGRWRRTAFAHEGGQAGGVLKKEND